LPNCSWPTFEYHQLQMWGVPTSMKLTLSQYHSPTKLMGRQNKFSSPPTPFETRDRNVTVGPANICCYHSNTFSITEMIFACYTLYLYKQLFSTLTNKQTIT
jgi:hypothetical protein